MWPKTLELTLSYGICPEVLRFSRALDDSRAIYVTGDGEEVTVKFDGESFYEV